MGFLEKIVEQAMLDVQSKLGKRRSLKAEIERAKGVPVIAEIKWASPSAGKTREIGNAVEIGRAMVEGGAVGLSVLTERRFFMGDPSLIAELKEELSVPILYKGFVVHPYQICEASCVGADAVLLIARILKEKLPKFMELAQELGMECLVEVFDRKDVELALSAGADFVGINNRDLDTLQVDLSRTERLIGLLPEKVTVVSESGISTKADVVRVVRAGADAVLVGTSIMKSQNPKEKVRELVGALDDR